MHIYPVVPVARATLTAKNATIYSGAYSRPYCAPIHCSAHQTNIVVLYSSISSQKKPRERPGAQGALPADSIDGINWPLQSYVFPCCYLINHLPPLYFKIYRMSQIHISSRNNRIFLLNISCYQHTLEWLVSQEPSGYS